MNGPATILDAIVSERVRAHPGQGGAALVLDNLTAYTLRALTARWAGRTLDVQYYIWKPDLTGTLLVSELVEAAERGVRVRVLIDDLNAHNKDSVWAALNQHENAQVRLFNPSHSRGRTLRRALEFLRRGFSLNRRMHNKAWIADGQVAIVGGRNIGDEYFGAAPEQNFLDADAVVAGPPVAEVSAIFDDFWNSRATVPLRKLVKGGALSTAALRTAGIEGYRNPRAAPYDEALSRQSPGELFTSWLPLRWSDAIHVYSDPPEKAEGGERRDWVADRLLDLAGKCAHELTLISPYFVPGMPVADLLVARRAEGLRVRVLTNSLAATDVLIVHGGYARYRAPLLRGGVEVFELIPTGKHASSLIGSKAASLHTKALVLDRAGFVGSFNLDLRSMNLNTEMGILFEDPVLVDELLKAFDWKTAAASSYRLWLQDGRLRWRDESNPGGARDWTHEPRTRRARRALARALGWLPIESQL